MVVTFLTSIAQHPIVTFATTQIQPRNLNSLLQVARSQFVGIQSQALGRPGHISKPLQQLSILNREKSHAIAVLTDGKAKTILQKKPEERTVKESVELYNFLLEQGKIEAEKVRDKEVVVFLGPTGGGKSTWINGLSGCELERITEGEHENEISVSKNSSIKAVAPIGMTRTSCTWTLKVVPDLIPQPSIDGQQKQCLTVVDTPGLDDNRGVEVTMANAMVLTLVLRQALSVRFVLTVEADFQSKGKAWKDLIKILQSRFNEIFFSEKNSLCVLITKNKGSLEKIKKQLQKYIEEDQINFDLSGCILDCDPLKNDDRNKLIKTIINTKAHEPLQDTQIALNEAEYFKATKIGKEIANSIRLDLQRSDDASMEAAVKKFQFIHGFSVLGSEELQLCLKCVSETVIEHARLIAQKIAPDVSSSLPTQINELKKYTKIKSYFHEYISFKTLDEDVRTHIRNTWHPYAGFNITRLEPTLISIAATVAWTATSVLFPSISLLAFTGALISGILSVRFATMFMAPNDFEQDIADFFSNL